MWRKYQRVRFGLMPAGASFRKLLLTKQFEEVALQETRVKKP